MKSMHLFFILSLSMSAIFPGNDGEVKNEDTSQTIAQIAFNEQLNWSTKLKTIEICIENVQRGKGIPEALEILEIVKRGVTYYPEPYVGESMINHHDKFYTLLFRLCTVLVKRGKGIESVQTIVNTIPSLRSIPQSPSLWQFIFHPRKSLEVFHTQQKAFQFYAIFPQLVEGADKLRELILEQKQLQAKL